MSCGVAPPDGVWSQITVDGEGVVDASCDDLGYGTLFHWQGDGVAAVATRPELLVAVAAAVAEPVSRDASIAAQLAYVGWLSPNRTGWVGIDALRAGERIRLADGGAHVSVDPWVSTWVHEPAPAPLADLAERASVALTDSVRRVLDRGHTSFADLTAGRDSRMILAALVALDALDSVTFQTIGGPDLGDVAVAGALAAHLGAEYRHGFFYPLPEGSFADRFRQHVEATAGVSNVMDGMREPLGVVDHVRLSGLGGEIVRGWSNPVSRDEPARASTGAVARAFRPGRSIC